MPQLFFPQVSFSPTHPLACSFPSCPPSGPKFLQEPFGGPSTAFQAPSLPLFPTPSLQMRPPTTGSSPVAAYGPPLLRLSLAPSQEPSLDFSIALGHEFFHCRLSPK